jgi:hypothetical protein
LILGQCQHEARIGRLQGLLLADHPPAVFMIGSTARMSNSSQTCVGLYTNKYSQVYNGVISPGWKWWQTVLEIEFHAANGNGRGGGGG